MTWTGVTLTDRVAKLDIILPVGRILGHYFDSACLNLGDFIPALGALGG